MPQPGKCWRHIIIGTHGSWLPGSPKGWRSRAHRVHSSGDYKSPPPEEEHAGLYAYNIARCPDAVTIPEAIRSIIGRAFCKELGANRCHTLVIAIAGQHCHVLSELPNNLSETKSIIGHAKRESSRAVKAEMPGKVWAAGGKFIRINDRGYQRRVFDYICRHVQEGAWVWTYRDLE